MEDLLQSIVDFLSDGFANAVDTISESLESVVSCLYSLIFVQSKDIIVSIGNTFYNYVYGLLGGGLFSLNLLVFIIGLCVFLALVKLAINVIRG